MFAVRPDEKFAKSSQRVAQLFFFKNDCPLLLMLMPTVLKIQMISVVNALVFRGHCDILRNFMTLSFVINLVLFQVLIADKFGIFRNGFVGQLIYPVQILNSLSLATLLTAVPTALPIH